MVVIHLKRYIIVICILALILTGCSNKKADNTSDDSNIPNVDIEDIHSDENSHPDPERKQDSYAEDNMNLEYTYEYDSGIYESDVKLSEPYKYAGKVYEYTEEETGGNTSASKETPIPSIQEPQDTQEPQEPQEPDVIEGNTELGNGENMGDTEISENPEIKPENPTDKPENNEASLKETASNLIDVVYNDIYISRMLKLNGLQTTVDLTEDSYDEYSRLVRNLKRSLEAIETMDADVKNKFSSDSDVVSSWSDLVKVLNDWRTKLSVVSTVDDFIISGLRLSASDIQAFDKLSSALNIYK